MSSPIIPEIQLSPFAYAALMKRASHPGQFGHVTVNYDLDDDHFIEKGERKSLWGTVLMDWMISDRKAGLSPQDEINVFLRTL